MPAITVPNEILIPEIVKLLREGHTATIGARGYSMRPFLEHNRDFIELRATHNPRIYDVVLAEVEPKKYVLHRVIKIEGSLCTLLGDGNLTTERCAIYHIYGKAVAFYRRGSSIPDRISGKKWELYTKIWMGIWNRSPKLRRYILAILRRLPFLFYH